MQCAHATGNILVFFLFLFFGFVLFVCFLPNTYWLTAGKQTISKLWIIYKTSTYIMYIQIFFLLQKKTKTKTKTKT